MTPAPLETYLRRPGHELAKRGLAESRIVAEAREHLVDAVTDGRRRGLSIDAAEREACARFGSPETVAAQFRAERYRILNHVLDVLTGLARLIRGNVPTAEYHFRDRAFPSRHQFCARLKWRARNRFRRMSPDQQQRFIARMKARGEDVSAFETDPREHLVRFLSMFGPRTLGPDVTLESLTLLDTSTDSTQRRVRYLAAFASGERMTWTVHRAADGTISLDGTMAPS